MLCDAVSEDEIFDAYLLYASLHGYSTHEAHVRARIASYRNNVPDSIIDEALLAYAEDRIIAPPDVVLACWGRSRIYELVQTPQHEWRHQVCENWFDNDCEFYGDDRDPSLYHFWTQSLLHAQFNVLLHNITVGTRLQLQSSGQRVHVAHRRLGVVGDLPLPLSQEIVDREHCQLRYLALVDATGEAPADPANSEGGLATCRLLITAAAADVGLGPMIAYARQAFQATRAKC